MRDSQIDDGISLPSLVTNPNYIPIFNHLSSFLPCSLNQDAVTQKKVKYEEQEKPHGQF